MTAALFADLVVLAGILSLGMVVSGQILGRAMSVYRLAVTFPLGAGVLAWVVFLASWMGLRIDGLTLVGIWTFCMALGWAIGAFLRRRGSAVSQSEPREVAGGPGGWSVSDVAVVALVAVLGLLTAYISVGRSYSAWDDMAIWSLKGYGIAFTGRVVGAGTWGGGAGYPVNLPMQIAFFRIASGDAIPGSKVLFPLYYVSLLLGCYAFWISTGVRNVTAALGALFVASAPVLFEHATIGYANLPFASYLTLGSLTAITGVVEKKVSWQVVGGLLLGLAAWTRPEGVLVVALIDLALLGVFLIARERSYHLGAWLVPQALIIGSWLVFSHSYSQSVEMSGTVAAAIASIKAGHPHLSVVVTILRRLGRLALAPEAWGSFGPVAALMILVGGAVNRGFRSSQWAVLTTAAIVGAAITGYYYLASFVGLMPLWKDSDFNRMFLPAWILLGVVAVCVAGRTKIAAPTPRGARGTDITRPID